MRLASLLPSTPAGLRGSEQSTVLFLVGLFGGCSGARVSWCGASRCRRVLGLGWLGGCGSVWGRCLSKLLFFTLLLLLLLLRAYAHEHPATSYRRSVDL